MSDQETTTMADQIIAKNDGGTFSIPEEGQYKAVCVDSIDLGQHLNEKFHKMRHKIALVFQIDAIDPETGKRFEINQRFTNSMFKEAALRKFLSQWRGKTYTDAEADAGAPLHKLVGVSAVLTIEHQKVGDKIYANIFLIQKLGAGQTPIAPLNYERAAYWQKVKEAGGLNAPPAATNGAVAAGVGAAEEDDSSLPF
jgi:hypothetical protein